MARPHARAHNAHLGTQGGLGSRLQAVASALIVASRSPVAPSVLVQWRPNAWCPGRFSSGLAPPPKESGVLVEEGTDAGPRRPGEAAPNCSGLAVAEVERAVGRPGSGAVVAAYRSFFRPKPRFRRRAALLSERDSLPQCV